MAKTHVLLAPIQAKITYFHLNISCTHKQKQKCMINTCIHASASTIISKINNIFPYNVSDCQWKHFIAFNFSLKHLNTHYILSFEITSCLSVELS